MPPKKWVVLGVNLTLAVALAGVTLGLPIFRTADYAR